MKNHAMFWIVAFLCVPMFLFAQKPTLTKQAIVDAVKKGDVATVKEILEANTDFGINDVYDKWGYTLLMHAVNKVQSNVVELLLKRGADPTIRAKDGFTVLDTVNTEMYLGSSTYKESQLSFMRLQKSSEDDIMKWLQYYEQQYSPEMQEKRLKIKDSIEKAYANKKNKSNKASIWNAIVSGELSEIEALLASEVSNINMQNEYGETPLIIAVKNGRYDVVELLLSKNAEIGIMDNKKETAYSYARNMLELLIRERQRRDVKAYKELILHQSIDLEQRDKNGETILMRTVANGNLDITKVLLEAGSNPDVKNNQGQTLKDIACTRGQYIKHKKLILALLDEYPKSNTLK